MNRETTNTTATVAEPGAQKSRLANAGPEVPGDVIQTTLILPAVWLSTSSLLSIACGAFFRPTQIHRSGFSYPFGRVETVMVGHARSKHPIVAVRCAREVPQSPFHRIFSM